MSSHVREFRACPVCWGSVDRTTFTHAVERHFDSAGIALCPASGETYSITLPERPRRALAGAA